VAIGACAIRDHYAGLLEMSPPFTVSNGLLGGAGCIAVAGIAMLSLRGWHVNKLRQDAPVHYI
jgi:hypothetical protein